MNDRLVSLLAYEQLNGSVRLGIAAALGQLVNDEEGVGALTASLPLSDRADVIHRALWSASRRGAFRVLVKGDSGNDQVEVVKR